MGLFWGSYAAPAKNLLVRDGAQTELPSKITLDVLRGDSVRAPGGGGYGEQSSSKEPDRSEPG